MAAIMLMIINFNNAILNIYSKANHKLALRFVFTQIIVLLMYRFNDNDIKQTSVLPIQKNTY